MKTVWISCGWAMALLLAACGGGGSSEQPPPVEEQEASASLDLKPVSVTRMESYMPDNWADGAVFVEIYVRGYKDSDGDGKGDLRGLTQQLDYLQQLGVEGIWLMPIINEESKDSLFVSEPKIKYNSFEEELLKDIKKLSPKRQEYYYYRIKADLIEEELNK